jgi:3-hydroxybutyryl-CoA dehydrogenase
MKIIAVIGAGTMGNGIAHTFAQSGFTVKLIDLSEKSLDKRMATIAANLDRMVKGAITQDDKAKTITNIITYTDIKDGVVGADLVEAATENVELKLNIFKQLNDACSQDTILATNTSSISITQIGAVVTRACYRDALYESGAYYEIG